MIRQASKTWHGVKVEQPDWGEHSHALLSRRGSARRESAYT